MMTEGSIPVSLGAMKDISQRQGREPEAVMVRTVDDDDSQQKCGGLSAFPITAGGAGLAHSSVSAVFFRVVSSWTVVSGTLFHAIYSLNTSLTRLILPSPRYDMSGSRRRRGSSSSQYLSSSEQLGYSSVVLTSTFTQAMAPLTEMSSKRISTSLLVSTS